MIRLRIERGQLGLQGSAITQDGGGDAVGYPGPIGLLNEAVLVLLCPHHEHEIGDKIPQRECIVFVVHGAFQ